MARFRADTSDLDAAVSKSSDGISGMHDSASGLNTHFDKASDSASGLTSTAAEGGAAFDVLSSKAEGVGSAVKNMVAGAIGIGGLAGLLDMAKNVTGEMQTLSVQFNSTFGGSGQADLAASVKLADQMGVSIGSAASAFESFGQATKGTIQNANKDMKEFADTAAGTGANIDSVAGSVGNFYEAIQRLGSSSGTRYATSLLTSHVIDQATYNKLHIESGLGESPQSQLDTILADMQKEYAGAGQAQAKTLPGELQTFQNQFGAGAGSAASPIMSGLTSGLADVNKGMQSTGFKTATTDVTDFVAVLAKGVAVLAPIAKDLGELGIAALSLVDHLGPLKILVEGVVAAFIVFEGLKIASSLTSSIAAIGTQSEAELSLKSSTDITTAAIERQTLAIQTLAASMAQAAGASMASAGVTGVPLSPYGSLEGDAALGSETSAAATSIKSRMGGIGLSGGGAIGIAGVVGSQMIGSRVGGAVGTNISDIGTGAAVGTMIAPGVGTAIGAAAGLVVASFQNAANAANTLAAHVSTGVSAYEKTDPVGSTPKQIEASYKTAMNKADSLSSQAQSEGLNRQGILPWDHVPAAATQKNDEALAIQSAYSSNLSNMHSNLSHIQSQVPGLSQSGAASLAASNGIDLTQSYASQSQAIKTATDDLNKFGGAVQLTAEALTSKLGSLSSIFAGQFGESSVGVQGILKKYGDGTTSAQIAATGKQAGIDINSAQYGGGGPNAINMNATNQMTPQAASEINSNIAVQQQLQQATFGVMQAQWGLIQAEQGVTQATFSLGQAQFAATQAAFSLTQAQFAASQSAFQYGQAVFSLAQAQFSAVQATFSLGQAVFSLGQANFSAAQSVFQLGQATLAAHVANISATDSASALATALASGYVPNNYDAASSVAQLTTATSAQISTYMAMVSANQALQASFQPVQVEMTALQAASQQATDSIKTYQLQLQSPLQGSGAYAQSHEATTVAGAGIQQQIDTLELQMVSSSDPRIQILQSQLAKINAQGDLQTQINTQTIGQQQFNIAQAQLPPETSYSSQLGAAQSIGSAQPAIIAAQTAVDNLTPSYDALSTAMTLSNTITAAATAAINALSGADQKAITANNGVTTAQNSVTTAANSVTTAQNGVTVAENGVTTAANSVTTAVNGVTTAANSNTVAQNGVTTALNNVAVAANGVEQAQIAITNAEQGVASAQQNVSSATASMAQAVNTNGAQMLANLNQYLADMQAAITQFGIESTNSITASAEKSELSTALANASGNTPAGLANEASTQLAALSAGKSVDPAEIASIVKQLAAVPVGMATGGVVGTGGLANVHAGEVVLPAQVVSEIAALGGSALQQKVGGALVNGIETSPGPNSAWELAGGIGPAAGLFQFEPQTWLGNGGGVYAGTTPSGMSGASVAPWQDQVQVFLNATKGNYFGDWGPDLGASYGYRGAPLPGSAVARNAYSTGGMVPGSGPVDATLHGGELVLSASMLSTIANGGAITQVRAPGDPGTSGVTDPGSLAVANALTAMGSSLAAAITITTQTAAQLAAGYATATAYGDAAGYLSNVISSGSQAIKTVATSSPGRATSPTSTPPVTSSTTSPGAGSTTTTPTVATIPTVASSGGGNSVTDTTTTSTTTVTMGTGSVQVNITIEGVTETSLAQTIATEATEAVNDALNQVIAQWQGK